MMMEKSLQSFYLVSISMGWLVLSAMIFSFVSASKRTLLWGAFTVLLSWSFFSKSIFIFYLLFELSLVPILLMIIYWGSQPERLSAGLYLLSYTTMLSMPLVVVIILSEKNFLFSSNSSVNFVFSILVLFPFLIKMPVLGLHFWLPKAHVEASTSGSMILAGVLLKLGSYGVFRFSSVFFIKTLKSSMMLWLLLSILSSLITFFQSDLKKLVAYSSVTHMTFMMVGLSALDKNLTFVIILLSLAHGWSSMALFSQAGLLSSSASSRLSIFLKTESKLHWASILLGLFLMMNASLPPFPSFFPELIIVCSLSALSLLTMLFVLLSLSVCYYNTLLFLWVSHSKSSEVKSGVILIMDCLKLLSLNFTSGVSLLWLILL